MHDGRNGQVAVSGHELVLHAGHDASRLQHQRLAELGHDDTARVFQEGGAASIDGAHVVYIMTKLV